MKKIAVLIIGNDSDLRAELNTLLQNTDGFECIGRFPDMEQVLKVTPAADVVLLDAGLQQLPVIQGISRIRHILPEAKIILLTGTAGNNDILQALLAGANGCLLKQTEPAQIIESINEVLNDGMPITPILAAKIINMFKEHVSKPAMGGCNLTPREYEVLSLLVDGYSYKQIAVHCIISIDTVRNHIRNIYRKLKVSSKSQAVAKALREGLI